MRGGLDVDAVVFVFQVTEGGFMVRYIIDASLCAVKWIRKKGRSVPGLSFDGVLDPNLLPVDKPPRDSYTTSEKKKKTP